MINEEKDIKTLPKVELHCHLDGIIDPAMARVIRQDNPEYPINPDKLECAYPVRGFKDFNRWYDFVNPIKGKLEYFFPILSKYVERLIAQNVVYSEVMIPSSGIPSFCPDKLDKAESVSKIQELKHWIEQTGASKIR